MSCFILTKMLDTLIMFVSDLQWVIRNNTRISILHHIFTSNKLAISISNLWYVSRIQIWVFIIWLTVIILFWHKRSYSWIMYRVEIYMLYLYPTCKFANMCTWHKMYFYYFWEKSFSIEQQGNMHEILYLTWWT